jgi:hypothetical protein
MMVLAFLLVLLFAENRISAYVQNALLFDASDCGAFPERWALNVCCASWRASRGMLWDASSHDRAVCAAFRVLRRSTKLSAKNVLNVPRRREQ